MTNVYIDFPDIPSKSFELENIPRIGKTIFYRNKTYLVNDVRYTIPDTYTNYNVKVTVELKKNKTSFLWL